MIRRAIAFALATSIGLASRYARAQDAAQCVEAANAATGLRKAKKLGEARAKLLVCAQEACDAVVRDECKQWLVEVEAARPTVVFAAKDASGRDLTKVRVTANGAPLASRLDGTAVALDPGEYDLRFEVDGLGEANRSVLVVEGQKSRLIEVVIAGGSAPEPPPASQHGRVDLALPAWIAFGVGAAGLVTFGALQGVAQSEYADLEDGCARTSSCTEDDVGPTEDKFIASMVMLGIGSAGVATAAILWIVDAASDAGEGTSARIRVDAGVGPSGVAVGISMPLGG
jgi:hypothetical protein